MKKGCLNSSVVCTYCGEVRRSHFVWVEATDLRELALNDEGSENDGEEDNRGYASKMGQGGRPMRHGCPGSNWTRISPTSGLSPATDGASATGSDAGPKRAGVHRSRVESEAASFRPSRSLLSHSVAGSYSPCCAQS